MSFGGIEATKAGLARAVRHRRLSDAVRCDLGDLRDTELNCVDEDSVAVSAETAQISRMAKRALDLTQLRQLPIGERLQLVGDLWDSIATDAPGEAFPVSPELAAELERRLAEHRANPDAARAWQEVKSELLSVVLPTR